MIGNVWEWTTDWYTPRTRRVTTCCARRLRAATCEPRAFDPDDPATEIPRKVMKGGSHLCAPNYCRRYRPAARMAQADRHIDEPPRLPLHRARRSRISTTEGATACRKDKPNILVIWGDDIGITNLSCYSDGLMGYRTPNIDRIANEGMRFTDSYGEQSCTAGRVVLHHRPERLPHRAEQGRHARRADRAPGRRPDDRRAAQAARLRHRPVRQEPPRRPERVPADRPRLRRVLRQPLPPERRGGARGPGLSRREDFPKFKEQFGPRGVLHCWATDKDDTTEQPRWGRVGKQKIEDTGPLTRKRMETCDDEFVGAAMDFIKRQHDGEASRSSAGSTPRTCTSGRTRSRRASARPGAGSRRTTTR